MYTMEIGFYSSTDRKRLACLKGEDVFFQPVYRQFSGYIHPLQTNFGSKKHEIGISMWRVFVLDRENDVKTRNNVVVRCFRQV